MYILSKIIHHNEWVYCIKEIKGLWSDSDKSFSSYEEALSAGITECLKLLEKED